MVRIERHPNGTRVRIKGWRLHHGAFGCLLVVVGIAGLALILNDWHDRGLWIRGLDG